MCSIVCVNQTNPIHYHLNVFERMFVIRHFGKVLD